jgi:hypothetical protein
MVMSEQGFQTLVLAHLEDIKGKLEKIDTAVFTGNGEPGLMSRVTALETTGSNSRSTWSVVLSVIAIISSALLGWFHK